MELGLIYGLIAFLAILTARFFPVLSIAPSCVFRSITGFPCPTCGATRSLVQLATGNVVSALAFNPLFIVIVLAALTMFIYSLVRALFSLPRLTFLPSEPEKALFRWIIVLALLLNWAYLVVSL